MPIPKWCDRKSIRTVKRGGATILVCCPKGKVRAGRCTVGTRAIEVKRGGFGALPRSWRGLKAPVSTPAGQSLHYVWALVSEHDGKWYVQATRPTYKAAVEAQRQNPRWTVVDTRKFPHRLY